jgi:AbrB family looped-hinge helix DNA binding protein
MEVHHVKVSKEGRILIPAIVRADLGLQEGSGLSLRVENGEIRLYDRAQALRRAQAIAQKFKKPGESVVDEFLKERRAEASRE